MTTVTPNPIEAAVAPLKSDAVARAEQEAREVIETVRELLAAAGNDLNVVAPYPTSSNRKVYIAAKNRRAFFISITRPQREATMASLLGREPMLVDLDAERVERFVEAAKENAAAEHDAFVAKLVEKIGPCISAHLSGNHVWQRSTLRADKADGTFEVWKTRMIVNRSCLGKLFNQFPTRKATA